MYFCKVCFRLVTGLAAADVLFDGAKLVPPMFPQDWRERIKSENPDASFGLPCCSLGRASDLNNMVNLYTADQGKLLGAKWKELDEEEKKVRNSVPP